jgi:hypothetical protein
VVAFLELLADPLIEEAGEEEHPADGDERQGRVREERKARS